MAPPELAADAPVLDVPHPLEIDAGPVVGHEAYAALLDGSNRRRRERFDVDEPLVGEERFEHRVGAIPARHHELVRLDAIHEPERRQIGDDAFAGRGAVEAAIGRGHLVVERRVQGHHVDHRQSMTQSDFIVVEIVRRRDLDAAGAERRVDVIVADHRDVALGERQAHLPADQVPVALIVGMHGDRGVPQHGLGPRRRHDEVAAVVQRVLEMPKMARLLLRDHFQVRQSRFQHRIPVDQPFTAVDRSVPIQTNEGLGDRLGELGIHRELVALPVHRGAQPAQLPGDRAARGAFPLPDFGNEGLAPEIEPAPAGRVQLALHHHLRGDAGVIGAGLPQRIEATHAPVPDQGVHDGVLERVAHVQRSGDVRRRNDDRVGRPTAARLEISVGFPAFVDARFDIGGGKSFVHGRSIIAAARTRCRRCRSAGASRARACDPGTS